MKITSQSAEELVLKEGSASGIVVGAVLVIGGPVVWYFLHQSNPVVMWIALGMVVLGVIVILMSSSITVIANKTSGKLSYEKKRLTGGQSSTYAIADVFRIETRKQWQIQNTQAPGNQGGSMPQPMLVAQSVIVFKDGRELALDHQKTSSSTSVGGAVIMGGQGAETAIAAQVAKFLNVPFQEIMPPNMSSGTNIIV
jgi:Tfp pilus assembly PilM family ATPase